MNKSSGTIVRSMTGQGHASGQTVAGRVKIEIRTVNHRGFKFTVRSPDRLARLEARIESVTRTKIHRGSVHVAIELSQAEAGTPIQIHSAVLAGYIDQCVAAIALSRSDDYSHKKSIDVASLVALPGVITTDSTNETDVDGLWKEVEPILDSALANLVEMRDSEGDHMAETLQAECTTIVSHVKDIRKLAPQVAEHYRKRLQSKVSQTLSEHALQVDQIDLLREVQIFADRSDISEELTRLDSHLQMFRGVLAGVNGQADSKEQEPSGRKLDFIVQEMFRETNTIGSKASHAEISAHVVEIKCAIERMRELGQNLE